MARFLHGFCLGVRARLTSAPFPRVRCFVLGSAPLKRDFTSAASLCRSVVAPPKEVVWRSPFDFFFLPPPACFDSGAEITRLASSSVPRRVSETLEDVPSFVGGKETAAGFVRYW